SGGKGERGPENEEQPEPVQAQEGQAERIDRSSVPDLPDETNQPEEREVGDKPKDPRDPGAAEAVAARVPDLPPEPGEPRGAIDSSGYRTTGRELAYVGVSEEAYANLQRGEAPLGMSPSEYQEFRSELDTALAAAGLSDADVRLQGTAATFYSRNPHKEFFADSEAIKAESERLRGDFIPPEVERDAVTRYEDLGYGDGPQPQDKVFDQEYAAFGDESLRSDYDVQVASDQLDARMREYQATNPEKRCISDTGGQWRDVVVRDNFPALAGWANRWTDRTGREVHLAGFDGAGPRGSTAFRDDDWVVRTSPVTTEQEE
ncbi:MAG: hypothetical protein ACRDT2_00370, partial [Natronosporangium sp.]